MLEVEIKARIDSWEKTFLYLTNIFTQKYKYFVKDIYFNHPCRDFKDTDEELRIRIEVIDDKNRVLMTYKGPRILEDRSVREEIEVEVNPKIEEILRKLGFTDTLVKEKEGWLFIDNEFRVTLCKVKGSYLGKKVYVGSYIEVEILVKKIEEIEHARTKILEFLRKIPGVGDIDKEYYTEKIVRAVLKS